MERSVSRASWVTPGIPPGRSVSRFLSRAVIHLGPPLPAASSSLPGNFNGAGRSSSPIWPCSRSGLPGPDVTAGSGGVLLPPFHPYPPRPKPGRAVCFCSTFPILADGGRYPRSCPVETGLSSAGLRRSRRHDLPGGIPGAGCRKNEGRTGARTGDVARRRAQSCRIAAIRPRRRLLPGRRHRPRTGCGSSWGTSRGSRLRRPCCGHRAAGPGNSPGRCRAQC